MPTEITFTQPQKVTIVESIIEQIVTQIRDGNLQPNDRLPSERQLMDMLGVGRSSVREALQGLAAMGLVEIRPGQGTFVRGLGTSEELLNTDIATLSRGLQKEMRKRLNQARLALESGILAIAAEAVTDETGASIKQALTNYERSFSEDLANADWRTHDRLHICLAQATSNGFLIDMLQGLISFVPDSLRDLNAAYRDPEEMREFHGTWRIIHRKLCDAVLSSDIQSARMWMRRHSEYEGINIDCEYGDQPSSARRAFQESIRRMA